MLNPKIDSTDLFFAAARVAPMTRYQFDIMADGVEYFSSLTSAQITAIVNAAYELGRNDERCAGGEKGGERRASYEIEELRADVDRLEDELSAEYNRGYEDGVREGRASTPAGDLLAQIRTLVGVETDAVAKREFAAGYDEGYGRGGADALDLVTKTLGTPDEIQAKILAAHSEGYALGLEAGYQDGYDDGREAGEWTHFGPKDAE